MAFMTNSFKNAVGGTYADVVLLTDTAILQIQIPSAVWKIVQ